MFSRKYPKHTWQSASYVPARCMSRQPTTSAHHENSSHLVGYWQDVGLSWHVTAKPDSVQTDFSKCPHEAQAPVCSTEECEPRQSQFRGASSPEISPAISRAGATDSQNQRRLRKTAHSPMAVTCISNTTIGKPGALSDPGIPPTVVPGSAVTNESGRNIAMNQRLKGSVANAYYCDLPPTPFCCFTSTQNYPDLVLTACGINSSGEASLPATPAVDLIPGACRNGLGLSIA